MNTVQDSTQIFINKTIIEKVRIEIFSLKKLLSMMDLDLYETNIINYLFEVMKQLPTSLSGFYGTYLGGLYDHTLFVANFALKFKRMINSEFFLQRIQKIRT